MNRLYSVLTLILFLFSFSTFAQKITITANHSDAKFYLLNDADNSEIAEIGTGVVELKLDKNTRNRIKVVKTGYEPLIKEYPKSVKWDKDQTVAL